jgi:hypothetical protein
MFGRAVNMFGRTWTAGLWFEPPKIRFGRGRPDGTLPNCGMMVMPLRGTAMVTSPVVGTLSVLCELVGLGVTIGVVVIGVVLVGVVVVGVVVVGVVVVGVVVVVMGVVMMVVVLVTTCDTVVSLATTIRVLFVFDKDTFVADASNILVLFRCASPANRSPVPDGATESECGHAGA